MFAAELNGKIPTSLQNHEDVLTSSVVGTFQYLSSPTYIQSLLKSCVNIMETQLTFASSFKECKFFFWPRLEKSEPDVLIHIQDEKDRGYLICIEAKYWSDKSSKEDLSVDFEERKNTQRDQLAREIEDIHNSENLRLLNIKKNIEETYLIYLTNHTSMPSKEMADSIHLINDITFTQEQLYWLPWRKIHNFINELVHFLTPQDAKLLKDLKSLLERKGLQSFDGFRNRHHIESVSINGYTYDTASRLSSWDDIQDVTEVVREYGRVTY
ncbi:hypothetical protein [Bacillus sp. V59.32b]|uniref:hypothetical protein n=1 Tax=Bacillus sp. V59.32b TaxID=1758642 RepID=UPI000E3C8BD3|nr:hypothetical protein [Bacillus sp. V59.32b]RFU66497.1 hypothetical protein D0463_09060 [Bacillus sp. V59.32b]